MLTLIKSYERNLEEVVIGHEIRPNPHQSPVRCVAGSSSPPFRFATRIFDQGKPKSYPADKAKHFLSGDSHRAWWMIK